LKKKCFKLLVERQQRLQCCGLIHINSELKFIGWLNTISNRQSRVAQLMRAVQQTVWKFTLSQLVAVLQRFQQKLGYTAPSKSK